MELEKKLISVLKSNNNDDINKYVLSNGKKKLINPLYFFKKGSLCEVCTDSDCVVCTRINE